MERRAYSRAPVGTQYLMGFASKVAATGKTALPPVVRMGFALPLEVLLFSAAMPLATELSSRDKVLAADE